MNLRDLLLSFALAAAACTLPPAGQLPCRTVGATTSECPSGQTCGSDLLCRDVVATCPDQIKQRQCGGNCVDVTKDPFNCGGCGGSDHPEFVCKAGEQCLADAQGVPHCTTYCAPGQKACPVPGTSTFICKDLSNDRTNCGACGTTCPTGQVCTPPAGGGDGHCAIECLPGLTNCSGDCKNTTIDPENCGGCGTRCSDGQVCQANSAGVGQCTVVCTPGLTQCGVAGSS
ncbi:MAG: hypothetical protein ACXWLM_01390, partial [Myxococcales bacterium]